LRPEAKERRSYWVAELAKLSGTFGNDSSRMVSELRKEIGTGGMEALIDHVRLCGAMPEEYQHDSSEEKLYSKYTDAIVSESLNMIGIRSSLISARADVADVQGSGPNYSLVADAKAFRLSRTAKNQKDSKVQDMDRWRGGLDFALLVCPIYQLPTRTSAIYLQAGSRNVCILSYSHLATILNLSIRLGASVAENALHSLLNCLSSMTPSKNATDYWTVINRTLLSSSTEAMALWTTEKKESLEALSILKAESLNFLRMQCDRLLRLSHQEAIDELIRKNGFDSRIDQVEKIKLGNLLEA
jgi:hypothetical protein